MVPARILTMYAFPIYAYHTIDDSGSFISTPPRVFNSQMRYLWEKGWKSLALEDFVDMRRHGNLIPSKTFVLTFDDGYKNNLDIAFPILKQYDFTATVFVVTDHIGGENNWINDPTIPRLPMLSWQDIRSLKDGGFDIQPHGRTHTPLDSIPADQVKAEVEGSRRRVQQETGCPANLFCYPHGKFNDMVISVLKTSAYKGAVTTVLGHHLSVDDYFKMKRIGSRFFRRVPGLFSLSTTCWGMTLLRFMANIKKKGMKRI